LIDGSEKRICHLSFDSRVRMLLKGAVKQECYKNEGKIKRRITKAQKQGNTNSFNILIRARQAKHLYE